MSSDLKNLQSKIDIYFDNSKVFKEAFTHSSFVNEQKNRKLNDNERLEFLGDAVLELTVSEYLFKKFPSMQEGQMTKLRASIVCEASLVKFAELLGFGEYILLGKGEELTGGRTRPALLADVFEAFIGALYLDKGLDIVKGFLEKYIFPNINHEEFTVFNDYKSMLQEFIQQDNLGEINYNIFKEIGPAHDREFHTEVIVNGKVLGSGVGKSKKDSEQKAAHEALINFKILTE